MDEDAYDIIMSQKGGLTVSELMRARFSPTKKQTLESCNTLIDRIFFELSTNKQIKLQKSHEEIFNSITELYRSTLSLVANNSDPRMITEMLFSYAEQSKSRAKVDK